jgi:hypothetical protein
MDDEDDEEDTQEIEFELPGEETDDNETESGQSTVTDQLDQGTCRPRNISLL